MLYSSLDEGLESEKQCHGPTGGCAAVSEHFAAPLAQGTKLVLQKWFYVSPVEPSTPRVPASICDAGHRAQCKPLRGTLRDGLDYYDIKNIT